MNDFIRYQSFSASRDPFGFLIRSAAPDWLLRGIMRSFGEDDVVAPYRPAPRPPGRGNPKSRIKNRK